MTPEECAARIEPLASDLAIVGAPDWTAVVAHLRRLAELHEAVANARWWLRQGAQGVVVAEDMLREAMGDDA